MTPPQAIIRLRRTELERALRLPVGQLQVLVFLLTRACPVTARVWHPPERIAEFLDQPVSLVEDALHALAGRDFLEAHPTLMHQLRCVELGPVFQRSHEPPENLPVEPGAAV